jgi:hypothetical protein
MVEMGVGESAEEKHEMNVLEREMAMVPVQVD